MSAITIQLPDDLAARIRSNEERLPEILEWGLRQLDQGGIVFDESIAILEFLAGSPTPQEVLDFRASDRLHQRVAELLEANRTRGLTPNEEKEWERYEHVEHLVRMAKTNALLKRSGKAVADV